jgi:hypothetical protein
MLIMIKKKSVSSSRTFIFVIIALTFILFGCGKQKILSQSTEELLPSLDDLPPGWRVLLEHPKAFNEWPTEDRIKAQQRGYIDGYQRTFANESYEMILFANSIYSNLDMESMYQEDLKNYSAPTRILDGNNESLERMNNPPFGEYSFSYKVTVLEANFSYFELYLIEANVINHIRCLVQRKDINASYKFCESFLNIIDKKIRKELNSQKQIKDSLITVPLDEFFPNRSDFPSGWGRVTNQKILSANIPPELKKAAGPGNLVEGHLQIFKNDTKNSVNIVSSLYTNAFNEKTFAPNNDEDIMNFTRITVLDPTLNMKLSQGPKISDFTWWVNLTRSDGSTFVNVFFGMDNMMFEVVCDMQDYNKSFALCNRIAKVIYDRIPKPAISYKVIQKQSQPQNISITFPVYNPADLIKKAREYIYKEYILPNGSVGDASFSEYNGTFLHIQNPDFSIEYLLIKINILKDMYGNLSLDEVVKQDCTSDAEMLGITYEDCLTRSKDYHLQYSFPSYLCLLNMTPSKITESIGYAGRCQQLNNFNIDSENQDFVRELGYHMTDELILKLMLADWIKKSVPIIEVKLDVNIGGLGCYPYDIRVYLDENLKPIASYADEICVD